MQTFDSPLPAPTAEATETALPATAAPTATSTPAPTATLLPEVTPVATESPTPEAPQPTATAFPGGAFPEGAFPEGRIPMVQLDAILGQRVVAAGSTISLTWQVTNADVRALEGLVLAVSLPDGLAPIQAEERPTAWQDAASRRSLRQALPMLAPEAVFSAQLSVRVEGVRAGAVVNVPAALGLDGVALLQQTGTSFTVQVGAPSLSQVAARGGQVALEGGRVRLAFAAGAVTETVRVAARALGRPADAPGYIRRAYEFVVRGAGDRALHRFTQPLTLTVQYDPDEELPDRLYVQEEGAPADGGGRWEALDTVRDEAARTLAARVPHLSVVGEGDTVVPNVMPSIRGVQNDLFTGAATIAYEIPLPAGAGGLVPQVVLQFNSHSRLDDPGNSSVLGTGWSLSADSWVADGWMFGTSTWVWRIDGVNYTEGQSSSGRYLREAPDWRIQRDSAGVEAWSPEGRHYHFERSFASLDYDGVWHYGDTKWLPSYVEDRAGNRIRYKYEAELPVNPATVDYGTTLPSTMQACTGNLLKMAPQLSTFTRTTSRVSSTIRLLAMQQMLPGSSSAMIPRYARISRNKVTVHLTTPVPRDGSTSILITSSKLFSSER